MKIRSVTDVITNSSSEVFSMKASDYEAVLQRNPGLLGDSDKKRIKIYRSLDELESEFSKFPNNPLFLELTVHEKRLLVPYRLLGSIREIIKDFGHTDQEILEYEASKDTERLKKRNSNKSLQGLLGVAYGTWYGPYWSDLENLMEYLDNCGIEYHYEGP